MPYIKILCFLCLLPLGIQAQKLSTPLILKDLYPSDSAYLADAINSMAEDLNWYPRSVKNWLQEFPQKAYQLDQCFRNKAPNFWFNRPEFKKKDNSSFLISKKDVCHRCFASNENRCDNLMPVVDTNTWLVLEFDCKNTADSALSKVLSELLIWKLKETGQIHVLDRVIQKRAMEEYQLQSSGLTETDTLELKESVFSIPSAQIQGACIQKGKQKLLKIFLKSGSITKEYRAEIHGQNTEEALDQLVNQINGNTNKQYAEYKTRKEIQRQTLQLGLGIENYMVDEDWTQSKNILSHLNSFNTSDTKRFSPVLFLSQRGIKSDHELLAMIPLNKDSKAALEYQATYYANWNWGFRGGITLGNINLLNQNRQSSIWNTKLITGVKYRDQNWNFSSQFGLNILKLHESNEYFATTAKFYNWSQGFQFEYDWENWTLGARWTLPFEQHLEISDWYNNQKMYYDYQESSMGLYFSYRLAWK